MLDPDALELEARPVAHLPVLRALIDQLQIHAILDDALPKHPLSRVSDADCVVAMMLNILCGRVALFRMDEWLARTDVELLLGPGREADAFDDNRLAMALDHLDELGTDTVLTAVVQGYLQRPNREKAYSVHQDFTSYSLYGEFEDVSPWGPVPAYGHSKDLRPDLKQLVYGLTLHGSAGLPLLATTLSGNTSDTKANRDHLARLSKLLPPEDEVTVVGDCKLVDGDTLGQLLCSGFHFVSLLPDSYTLRTELVAGAWAAAPDAATWPVLGSHPGRLKDDPATLYRGKSVDAPFSVTLRKQLKSGTQGPQERGVDSVCPVPLILPSWIPPSATGRQAGMKLFAVSHARLPEPAGVEPGRAGRSERDVVCVEVLVREDLVPPVEGAVAESFGHGFAWTAQTASSDARRSRAASRACSPVQSRGTSAWSSDRIRPPSTAYALTFLTRQWRRVIFGDAEPDSRSLRVCLA
jgi:hypothetical protein